MARPLRVGDEAPPFSVPDSSGRVWTPGELRGAPYVLFFYPKDETPGCIREACSFRDAWVDFRGIGVPVLGVSRDDAESHRRFAEQRRIPYALLCDEDGAMHETYGATMLGGIPRRVSYLVDAHGRIAKVFDSHLRPEAHAEKMLEAARALLAKTT